MKIHYQLTYVKEKIAYVPPKKSYVDEVIWCVV